MMLAYSEYGHGPALVLLHAFPMDRSLYRDVVAPIAEAGWHVITPDLPGFGASTTHSHTMEDMAAEVAAMLDVIGVHSAVIGGCSMGGYVAMAFAAQFPTRTAGLVLIDTKANADGDEARANRERIAAQVERAGSLDALAVAQPSAMFAQATQADQPGIVTWLQNVIRAQRPAAVADAQRAMARRVAQFDMLRGLAVPVLCIRGAEDAVATAEDHARMAAAAQDALDVTVPDAGHLVPIEQPAAFVASVLPFLDKVRVPRC